MTTPSSSIQERKKHAKQKEKHNFEILDGAITNLIQEINHIIEEGTEQPPRNFEEWSTVFFEYTNLVLGRYSQYVLTFADHIKDMHIDHSTGQYIGGTCDEIEDSEKLQGLIKK